MKFTGLLALSLTFVVLLALGAVGFADKTEELLLKSPSKSGTLSPGTGKSSGDADHETHSSGSESNGSQDMDREMNEGKDMEGHNMDMMDSSSDGGEHAGH